MSLQFFEKYMNTSSEVRDPAIPDQYGCDVDPISTVHDQYNQLLKLITTAIDTAMPPTLVLSGTSMDIIPTLKLTAPTECYRDHRNGKQRPTDFAPLDISITPLQYQLAWQKSSDTSACMTQYTGNYSLGQYLTPITFTICACNERYSLKDSIQPALHCILFHENLAKEADNKPDLITSISESFI